MISSGWPLKTNELFWTANEFFAARTVVAIKNAILAGVGIGMIPDYMVEDESDFVPVLTKTEDEQPSLPILFVYPEELKSSKKVQVLRDFLVAKARQWKD